MSASADGPKLEILICYAIADAGFAAELADGLEYGGQFKVMAVGPEMGDGEDSKFGRGDLIASADIVVFVLSPAAAASPMFHWEAGYAHKLSKLVQPILLHPLDGAAMPATLTPLSHVHFDGEHSFMEGLKALVGRFPTDTDWLQDHTELSMRARKWDEAGRPASHLLTDMETAGAKSWTIDRPDDAPKPSDLHMEFITASEAIASVATETPARAVEFASGDDAEAASSVPADNAQALQKANKFYAVIAVLLAIVAAIAAWQALEQQRKVVAANKQVEAQQQIAELSKVTLAIQKERIEEAIKSVNAGLCAQAQTVANTLSTTSDPSVWDKNYNLFWILYEGPLIALEQLHGTLSETDRSPVAATMIEFGKNVGTRGEPYEARVTGLPKPDLLEHAASITATCKKVTGASE